MNFKHLLTCTCNDVWSFCQQEHPVGSHGHGISQQKEQARSSRNHIEEPPSRLVPVC